MEACSKLNSHQRLFNALMMQASQGNIHEEALSWHRKHHVQSLGKSSCSILCGPKSQSRANVEESSNYSMQGGMSPDVIFCL